jgi:hypothetical protein
MKIEKQFNRQIEAFIKVLGSFACELSCLDRIWNILFPDALSRWQHLRVIKYKQTFCITHIDEEYKGLEFESGKAVRVADSWGGGDRFGNETLDRPDIAWAPLISAARRWLGHVRRDWMTYSMSCTTPTWEDSSAGSSLL